VRLSLLVASGVGRVFFRLDRKHRLRSIDHVRLAFPDWHEDRVIGVARRSCQRFLQLAIEMVFMPRRITKSNYERHLVRNHSLSPQDMFYARQPMVLVTGHFGNWESAGYFISLEGHAIAAAARPLDNPLINDWLLALRRRHGMNVIEKWDRADVKIVRALENREAIAFIADQNGGERGVFVPFFGRLASTPKTVGLLAISRALPVICGYGRRIERYRLKYEIATVDVIRPEEWADHADPLFYITARYVRAIEQMVRAHPEDYLWMHRRWKSRPRFEREATPMPAALERKLRTLPWVDDAMMRRLREPLRFETR
jgi:Kdo2-lipid IVA lauroyltransferase/acyltransferase